MTVCDFNVKINGKWSNDILEQGCIVKCAAVPSLLLLVSKWSLLLPVERVYFPTITYVLDSGFESRTPLSMFCVKIST